MKYKILCYSDIEEGTQARTMRIIYISCHIFKFFANKYIYFVGDDEFNFF